MNRTIFYLFLILLIWTPFAFGSVHALAYSLLELHVFFLIVLGMAQGIFTRRRAEVSPVFIWTPIAIPLALFLILLALQVLPLPPYLLGLLSPSTVELYHLYLPDWPNIWMPLSLNPYKTQIAIVQLLAYTGVFFLVVNTVRTRHQIRTIGWVIVAVATGMALIGMAQRFSGVRAIYWFRDVNYVENFFGPYVNGNHFAAYMVMAAMLGLGLLFSPKPVGSRERDDSRRLFADRAAWALALERTLLLGCLAVMVSALLLSRSRGGFLAFLVGLVGFVVLFRFRRQHTQAKSGLVAMLVVIGCLTLWFGGPLFLRFAQLIAGQEVLVGGGGRMAVYQATWEMAKDFPIFGIGYEAFAIIFPRYQTAGAFPQTYAHAHNDVLQLLAETGGVGFACAVVAAVVGAASIMRRWRQRHDPFVQVMVPAGGAACLAIGAHSLVDFNLHIPANALVATTILALTFACVNVAGRQTQADAQAAASSVVSGRTKSRVTSWVALVGGLGIVIWASVAAAQVGVADWYYPQLRSPDQKHWTHNAAHTIRVSRLKLALSWTPDNSVYLVGLADLSTHLALDEFRVDDASEEQRQQALAKLEQALALYKQSLQQSPTDPEARLGWLRILQNFRILGTPSTYDTGEEMALLCERAAALAPTYAQIQFGLGTLLLYSETGASRQTALPYFRRAVDLDKRFELMVWNTYQRALSEVEALQFLARTMPNTAEGHLKAARVLQNSHWPQARLHYRAALALSRSNPNILNAYAEALIHHQDFEAAQPLWSRYTELAPKEPNGYLQLASASRAIGDDAGEVQALEKLVSNFPQQADYETQLAQAYDRLGKSEKAAAAWQRVISLQPDSQEAYINLARQHEHRGEHNKALQVYLKLANLRPQDANLAFQIGEYYRRDGDALRAIAYFRRAVDIKPDHDKFRQALEDALQLSRQ